MTTMTLMTPTPMTMTLPVPARTPATVRPIERTHSQETQLTLDLLNYVAVHQPCKFEPLFALLPPGHTSKHDADLLRHRLSHLVFTERLSVEGTYGAREFSLGLCAYSGVQNQREQARAKSQQANFPQTSVATPDRYDRLHGALYVPPVVHGLRMGSQDHLRHTSRGHAC